MKLTKSFLCKNTLENINSIIYFKYLYNLNLFKNNNKWFSNNSKSIPSLKDFLHNNITKNNVTNSNNHYYLFNNSIRNESSNISVPYTTEDINIPLNTININKCFDNLNNKKFYIETYGCQMNQSDTEVVKSILLSSNMIMSENKENADLILLNTCAIRESAEEKVLEKIKQFKYYKYKNNKLIIGVLGCMAERKKQNILEYFNNIQFDNEVITNKDKIFNDNSINKINSQESINNNNNITINKNKKLKSNINVVDLIAGPDSYRDLPRMINSLMSKNSKFEVNVQLSLDETYAEIVPTRLNNDIKAFVSIMRGCNNMCTYCIVPFTRGTERSRDLISIINEISSLVEDSNQSNNNKTKEELKIKEITLLGQNVNSYLSNQIKDIEFYNNFINTYIKQKYNINSLDNLINSNTLDNKELYDFIYSLKLSNKKISDGFKDIQKLSRNNNKECIRFNHLLFILSNMFPNIRFRFTSPHPKEFPDSFLLSIKYINNIAKNIHLPLQSGSSKILDLMRRLYDKESFVNLVEKTKKIIPNIKISTDIIVGFCEETESDFEQTLEVCKYVNFDTAFMFMYSMREKTFAHRKLKDNVAQSVKEERLKKLIDIVKNGQEKNNSNEIGNKQLILIEGNTKKNYGSNISYFGKNEGNLSCVIRNVDTCSMHFINDINKGSWVIATVNDYSANTLFCNNIVGVYSNLNDALSIYYS